MDFFTIRVLLTACIESIYYRATTRVLTMRSNLAYYVVAACGFVINTLAYTFQLSVLRSALGTFFYICVPVLMSVGRLRTRITRSLLLYFVMMFSDVIGSAVYALLMGDVTVLDHIGPDNIAAVITVYLTMMPVLALMFEIVAAQYERIDGEGVALFEMPVIGLMLTSLLSFRVSSLRLFSMSEMAQQPYAALFAFFFLFITLLVVFLVYSSAKHEAEARRETLEHAFALRKARHTQREVETMARRAEGMHSLRHELANKVRSIHSLAESGDNSAAASQLSDLRAQAQVLKGEAHE